MKPFERWYLLKRKRARLAEQQQEMASHDNLGFSAKNSGFAFFYGIS